jgi:hypothetical protein
LLALLFALPGCERANQSTAPAPAVAIEKPAYDHRAEFRDMAENMQRTARLIHTTATDVSTLDMRRELKKPVATPSEWLEMNREAYSKASLQITVIRGDMELMRSRFLLMPPPPPELANLHGDLANLQISLRDMAAPLSIDKQSNRPHYSERITYLEGTAAQFAAQYERLDLMLPP